jgi:hypothetical protein
VGGEGGHRRSGLGRVADSIHLLGLKSGLQTEVLREIVDGPRTIRELVNIIYGEDRGSSSFETHYARVRRAARYLEARGYVSASLFGREKPYRLTRHGERCLANLASGFPAPTVMLRTDAFLFAVTLLLGILNLPDVAFPQPATSIVSAAFLVLLGVSLCRGVTILREVG